MFLEPLVFLILRFFAVHTTDTSSRVIQKNPIKCYWNIPTFQCAPHKVNFTDLAMKYGILQNENDRFRGRVMSILYDPGNFPALLHNETNLFRRNGGVPQAGNLSLHLDLFAKTVDELIPDVNFQGISVIDFESWRPIFRQNFGTLVPYKDLSFEIEQRIHPFWSKAQIKESATLQFEFFAQEFMEKTLLVAKRLRPKATWGYYAYPYCFNMSPSNMRMQCPLEVQRENERIKWLFSKSDNLHPSVYLSGKRLTTKEKTQMVDGRIQEARRISNYVKNSPAIVPYFYYKYPDNQEFVSKEDLFNTFTVLANSNIDGLIIWGSSNDVNSKKRCVELYDYMDRILGPILANVLTRLK